MPTILEVMQSRMGISEVPGKKANPEIVQWFEDAGHPEIQSDEIANCSACVASAAVQCGLPTPPHNVVLLARSWLTWGVAVPVDQIQPGDIAIWPRAGSTWMGHVNVVSKVTKGKVACIGANQGDKVTLAAPRSVKEALGFRRAVPATVKALRPHSSDIKKGDTIQASAVSGSLVATTVAVVADAIAPPAVTPVLKSVPDTLDFWQSVLGGANACAKLVMGSPWLAGVVVCGLVAWWTGHRLKAARVARHEVGAPIHAEIARLGE